MAIGTVTYKKIIQLSQSDIQSIVAAYVRDHYDSTVRTDDVKVTIIDGHSWANPSVSIRIEK